MAQFYTNENMPVQVVTELRRLGHDVITSLDAGKANSTVPGIPSTVLQMPKFWRTRRRRAGFS
jgi:hypothetical protein